ncbi:transglycosylase-like protein with SLT domain [Streptomyces sp. 3211.6]|uniref:aggregation-promoting factor C-terminal-like domain-containing protein n=1 Tax=Streptomyces TaxID=1883 RepID=UPI0009A51AE8|nr:MULTISPECIES: transglycosylase SLT domain-containing protein [Streptomyces]RKT06644.1 transglycosylase-like protein with SLT domain [Streptomyces sp. 3211.6]RPF45819.1 transglycosylase-like protein with SLT domain [Streptomyces sp. Ag109_G2-6]
MSRISVRGFAVASATAVTTVGAVVGVATGDAATSNDLETTASGATLLTDVPVGEQAQVQSGSLAQQADAIAHAADADAKRSAEEAARIQAAEDAKSKKADAQKAEQEKKDADAKKLKDERDAAEGIASRSATRDAGDFPVQGSYTVAQVKDIARQLVPSGQFQCFSNIINEESTWNYQAVNSSSGAYGLVQALPGSKMASAGSDWRTNPATQIKWGLGYMNERYGSPCSAWSFHQANGWY